MSRSRVPTRAIPARAPSEKLKGFCGSISHSPQTPDSIIWKDPPATLTPPAARLPMIPSAKRRRNTTRVEPPSKRATCPRTRLNFCEKQPLREARGGTYSRPGANSP